MTSQPDLKIILAIATDAAHVSGNKLKETWHKSDAKVLMRTQHDVKLSADINSEKIITKIIKERRPNDGIIAEESGESNVINNGVWVVDPLDGTVNFSHGQPHFCVSIAWLWQGKINVGVIYDPIRDELFTAARGCGAFLNGKIISVAENRLLAKSMIAVGFGQAIPKGKELSNFDMLGPKVQKLRISGSAALDLAYVACGRLDAYVENSVFLWDLAAGSILIEEAGGNASIQPRERTFMRSCIAANKTLFPQLYSLCSF